MPAEAFLVGQPGDPHHHRIAVLALGEEAERGGLAADLVGRVVQVGEVLNLRHRQHARQAGAQRQPEDGLLVKERVEHPSRAELAQQPAGHPVDAALAGHILPEHEHVGPGGQGVGQGGVDDLGQGHRAR